MDFDRIKRKQSLKVIVSEATMVLAVILMVIALAFIVSGYWVGSDFKIERQGLIQISSVPTGANIEIDGMSSWLQRTNSSKVLASGDHKIMLSKDGYDTWSKTINLSEGLLYRLSYPRLFLKDRILENVSKELSATLATISPNREMMLAINTTTEWLIVDLTNDEIKPKPLSISSYFNSVSIASDASVGLFTGKILEANWNRDNSRILLKSELDSGSFEWVLLDIRNPQDSINLTKKFGYNFDRIKILDSSADNLLGVQNGNLHKISISSRSVSSVIATGVIDFDHYNNEIVFSAQSEKSFSVNFLKLGEDQITKLESTNLPVKVAISRFYDDKYITILSENTVFLHKKNDFSDTKSFKLSFNPTTIKVGHNGNFILLYSASNLAAIDMESFSLSEWQIESEAFGWLDNYMIYTVINGELVVYDYDGLNRRTLSKNVSSRFPVTITDDKWLYYFNDNNLVREWLVPR